MQIVVIQENHNSQPLHLRRVIASSCLLSHHKLNVSLAFVMTVIVTEMHFLVLECAYSSLIKKLELKTVQCCRALWCYSDSTSVKCASVVSTCRTDHICIWVHVLAPYQLVNLGEGGFGDPQSLRSNPVQSCVV